MGPKLVAQPRKDGSRQPKTQPDENERAQTIVIKQQNNNISHTFTKLNQVANSGSPSSGNSSALIKNHDRGVR